MLTARSASSAAGIRWRSVPIPPWRPTAGTVSPSPASCAARSTARPRPRRRGPRAGNPRSTRDPLGSDSRCRSTSSASRCSRGRCSPRRAELFGLERCLKSRAIAIRFSSSMRTSGSMFGSSGSRAGELLQQRADLCRRAWWSTRRSRARCAAWPETTRPRVLARRWCRRGRGSPTLRHAVVEHTGHQHPDGARSEGERHRPEQRVDRRPVSVLRRTFGQHHSMVVHEEVPVGYGDVDRAGFERRRLRRRRGQGSVAVEDLGQHARRVGRHVQHDQDRVGKIRGEVRGESPSAPPPRRRTRQPLRRRAVRRWMTRRTGHLQLVTHAMWWATVLSPIGPSRAAAGEIDATPVSGR